MQVLANSKLLAYEHIRTFIVYNSKNPFNVGINEFCLWECGGYIISFTWFVNICLYDCKFSQSTHSMFKPYFFNIDPFQLKRDPECSRLKYANLILNNIKIGLQISCITVRYFSCSSISVTIFGAFERWKERMWSRWLTSCKISTNSWH